jgi:hypothetical protein
MHNKMLLGQKHPIKDLQKVYNTHGADDIHYTPMEDVNCKNKEQIVLAYRAAMTARN